MSDWNEALEHCDTIIELIKEEIPDRAWDEAPEFFEGVQKRIGDMQEWIQEKEHITPKMTKSLENMERGVRKWIKD